MIDMVKGYCLNCKADKEMQDMKAKVSEKGVRGTEGACPTCGGKIYVPQPYEYMKEL